MPKKRFSRSALYLLLCALGLLAVAAWFSFTHQVEQRPQIAKKVKRSSKIRPAQVAGSFYPLSKEHLSKNVSELLNQAPKIQLDPIRALILPHAGYVYSGSVAAAGFKQLEDVPPERVIIVASNHNPDSPPFAVSAANVDYYETPLGKVKVSDLTQKLLGHPAIEYIPEAHQSHVIEVMLPFLQTLNPSIEIVPLITGRLSTNDSELLVKVLAGELDHRTLLLISSDLSHYHPYAKAVGLDTICTTALAELDQRETAKCEACGLPAAKVLQTIAIKKGWQGQVLMYKNSGDTAGNKDGVVGYSSIAYLETDLSLEDKIKLIQLSRDVLENQVRGKPAHQFDPDKLSKRLHAEEGCFVTLNKNHQLRGCIGSLAGYQPLYECVVQNTINAATQDKRFNPVQESELQKIKLEISVLTPPAPLGHKTPDELLEGLTPLRTGVILRQHYFQSTFLPQVWKQLPDKIAFLSRLCLKAGMKASCWQDPETEVLTYTATAFEEN